MDIIVKSVLDLIQGQKNYEYSVIAGGSCRDHFLGIEPKDYDIFLPYAGSDAKYQLTEVLNKELGVFDREKGRDYGGSNIRGVNEFTFEGKTFDLIFKQIGNDDEFGKKVIDDFDYGYNKAYYDGLSIYDEHNDFLYDRNNWCMTLLNLDNIDALPKVIGKFNRVNEKLQEAGRGQVYFRNQCLVLKEGKEWKPKTWTTSTTTGLHGHRLIIDDLPVGIPAGANIAPRVGLGLDAGAVGRIPPLQRMPDPWDMPVAEPARQLRPADIRAAQRLLEENDRPVEWQPMFNPVREIPLPEGWQAGARQEAAEIIERAQDRFDLDRWAENAAEAVDRNLDFGGIRAVGEPLNRNLEIRFRDEVDGEFIDRDLNLDLPR